MENCIFCKIAKGELPAAKIWEDENHVAFLDISPATRGHTLIIPKEHYENLFDIPEEKLTEIAKISKEIALLIKEKLNADGINLLNSSNKCAQQEVPHFHMHVIPRYEGGKFKLEPLNKTLDKNLEKVKKEILG